MYVFYSLSYFVLLISKYLFFFFCNFCPEGIANLKIFVDFFIVLLEL